MKSQLPDEIIEAYVFANTPAYLYRKLRDSEFVVRLTHYSDADLNTWVKSAYNESIESVALAYAALFALLRKNSTLTINELLTSSLGLEWANALISLYYQRTPSISEQTIKMPTTTSISNEKSFNPSHFSFTSNQVSKDA